MGIEPFLITSTLEAVLAQRLVRTICQNCREEYMPELEILEDLGVPQDVAKTKKFYRGAGCSKCNDSGYKGRTAILELLVMNEKLRLLVIEKAHTAIIKKAAVESGMKTLLEDGLLKIYSGVTTIEEVLREAQTVIF